MTERSEIDAAYLQFRDAHDQAERTHAERVERYRRHIRVIDDALRFVAGMAVVFCAAWAITRIFTP